MKNLNLIILLFFILLGSTSCNHNDSTQNGPKLVKLEKNNGQYRLTVNGDPFFVKGAGCEYGNIEALARHGANSMRTWRTDNGQQTGLEVLDKAQENGLLVCMGLEIGRERHGFDYNDEEAVKKQFDYVKSEVLKYKDHPALLAWGIGNELNLHASNLRVWSAVNDIARMIHTIDPNHPVTTMLAGFDKGLGDQMDQYCPDLDFLCFQFYADIINLPNYLQEAKYKGAYIVSEWGATGHWESPMTEWGRPIEQNSKDKADSYLFRYETAIAADPKQCIGSYVFLWGQKQERTPTWYGMFLENGNETASVDVLHYIWNGSWPMNKTPQLDSVLMNSQNAYSSVKVGPDSPCSARVIVSDPDGDPLSISWEIIPEVPIDHQSDGGDAEPRQISLQVNFNLISDGQVEFQGPKEAGQYRLFVYASDGQGHTATANIPFLVE